jgi:hypothetical protein
MALSAAQIDRLCAVIAEAGPDAASVLRAALPPGTLTTCDARDVDTHEPAARLPGWELHLVDASNHCWALTDNPQQATGIVLAATGA